MLSKINQYQAEYEDLYTNAQRNKMYVFLFSLIITFFILKLGKRAGDNEKQKYTFYKPETNYEYFRDIPSDLDPNLAATLAFCKCNKQKKMKHIYSALLLSLVRKKYIELTHVDSKSFLSNKTTILKVIYDSEKQDYEMLTASEDIYFNLIARHSKNSQITMKQFQHQISIDYQNTSSFVNSLQFSVYKLGLSKKYLQTNFFEKVQTSLMSKAIISAVLGVSIILALNFFSSLTRLDLAYGSFFIIGLGFLYNAYYFNKLSKSSALLTQERRR